MQKCVSFVGKNFGANLRQRNIAHTTVLKRPQKNAKKKESSSAVAAKTLAVDAIGVDISFRLQDGMQFLLLSKIEKEILTPIK